jgi:hypothetical protein
MTPLRQVRERMIAIQDKIVADMKIEPDLAKLAVDEIRSMGKATQ